MINHRFILIGTLLTCGVAAAAFLGSSTFIEELATQKRSSGNVQTQTRRENVSHPKGTENISQSTHAQPDHDQPSAHDHKYVEPQRGTVANSDPIAMGAGLKRLLSLAAQVSDDVSEAQKQEIGREFLDQLRHSPQLLDRLMGIFDSYKDGAEKQFLKDMLVSSAALIDHDRVEQFAINRIYNDTTHDAALVSAWYSVIEDTGIRSAESRRKMFTTMPSLTEPKNLRSAILSIVPLITQLQERQNVAQELAPYVSHPDDKVRSAAVEVLGQWIGNSQSHIVENALIDNSGDVRHAAATAALMTNVQTDKIKSSLLAIMNNESEEPDIRTQAHYALTKYSLDGSDYESFYRFHEDLHNHATNEVSAN